jgi:flagellar biosynthesis protein FlhA
MGRNVVSPYLDPTGKLFAVILEPSTEQRLSQAMLAANQGGGLGIAPNEASTLVDQLGKLTQEALAGGHDPVLLTTATLRRSLRQITSRFYPDLAVISYSELAPGINVDVVGTLTLSAKS